MLNMLRYNVIKEHKKKLIDFKNLKAIRKSNKRKLKKKELIQKELEEKNIEKKTLE